VQREVDLAAQRWATKKTRGLARTLFELPWNPDAKQRIKLLRRIHRRAAVARAKEQEEDRTGGPVQTLPETPWRLDVRLRNKQRGRQGSGPSCRAHRAELEQRRYRRQGTSIAQFPSALQAPYARQPGAQTARQLNLLRSSLPGTTNRRALRSNLQRSSTPKPRATSGLDDPSESRDPDQRLATRHAGADPSRASRAAPPAPALQI
jgi:hypothetical protein